MASSEEPQSSAPWQTIAVKDFLRSGAKELRFDTAFGFDDLPLTQPAHVQARVLLTATGLRIVGSFQAEAEEPCDRCTEPYHRAFSDSFDERYVFETFTETGRVVGGRETELLADDFYDTLGPEGVLDVADLIHQHLVMALSIDRFCKRPDCSL